MYEYVCICVPPKRLLEEARNDLYLRNEHWCLQVHEAVAHKFMDDTHPKFELRNSQTSFTFVTDYRKIRNLLLTSPFLLHAQ